MTLLLISALLGASAYVVQVNTSEEALKVSVSVWPPGSNVHLGENVLLQCTVKSNSSSVRKYRWFRNTPDTVLALNPRHLVSGDSYSITGVTRDDAGTYWCQAERGDSNSTMVLFLSQLTTLSVSEAPCPILTMLPSSRHIFSGENFTLYCPVSPSSSSGWRLRHFSQDGRVASLHNLHTDHCSPLGGTVSADGSNGCSFLATGGSSGLYWCDGAEGRSNGLSITVSYASMIVQTPASPVSEGQNAVLYCQYRRANPSHTSFYKNGVKMNGYTSGSNKTIMMTVENVTQGDEGFYRCKSEDGMESAESWLSVLTNQGNSTRTDEFLLASTNGYGKWIIVSCGMVLLLFFVPVTAWLVWHNRYKAICTRSCWPRHKEDVPAVAIPVTKHDATEVQWDLSWMEMSNLLDKNLYPGT